MDLLVQILLFFVLGLALFALDAWAGVGLYRVWYGMTHKEPLAPDQRRGFLVHRKASVRMAWALGIAGVIALISVRYGSFFQDSTRVTLTLLAMLVGLGLGLLAAPTVLARLPGMLNGASDYVDAVERGDRRPGEDLRKTATKATEQAIDKASDLAAELRSKPAEPSAAAAKAEPHAGEGPKKSDAVRIDAEKGVNAKPGDKPADGRNWRKGVGDFLDK